METVVNSRDEKIDVLTQENADLVATHDSQMSEAKATLRSCDEAEQEKSALEERLESQRAEFDVRSRASTESLETANQTHSKS